MKKENEFSCIFGHNIISNGLYQAIRNNIDYKTTELVLLFHKNITKLVFLWSNMSQKSFKVLKFRMNIANIWTRKKQFGAKIVPLEESEMA